MAVKINRLSCCYWFVAFCMTRTLSYLDVEELRNSNYGIDIVNEPVRVGQEESESVVHLTSKFGQQYQCSFPNHVQQEKQKEEEEKQALETGILQLLQPFQSQGCLFKTKDWWSYEFCYQKHIRQMHIEDGAIKGEVIYLGHFESDFDWDNRTKKEQRLKSRSWQGRYHSQTYTNGSKCDLTQQARRTEVRFYCEDSTTDYIGRIDESETCVYIISIHTSRICSHPYLKLPEPKKPVPITCHPVLNEEQYGDYLVQLEVEEKERERLAAEAKDAEEAAKSSVDTESVDSSSETEAAEEGIPSEEEVQDLDSIFGPSVESLMKKTLTNDMKNLAGTDPDVKMSFKVIKDAKDIEDFLKEALHSEEAEITEEETLSVAGIKESPDQNSPSASKSEQDIGEGGLAPPSESPADESDAKTDTTLRYKPSEKKKKGSEGDGDDVSIESEDDAELFEEFDRELGHLKTVYKNQRTKFAKMKNKVRDSVKLQFEDIIDEAEEMYGEEVDKKMAFKQLAGTLDKLIKKLENTEKEIDHTDKELGRLTKRLNKKGDVEEEGIDDAEENDKPKGPSTTPPITKDTSVSRDELPDDDRVKVRVTKIKAGDLKGEEKVSDKQTEQLEQTVKEGLIKAGLDTGGGKIQVKIITAGYTDNEDEVHLLSQEDTTHFQNMIVAILGGTNEASKEAERQQKLEDNYSFVWGETKSKKSKLHKGVSP